MARNQEYEDALVKQIAGFRHDPEGFVLFGFPWGEPGELESFSGPQPWQIEQLRKIGDIVKGCTTDDEILAQLFGEVLHVGAGKGRLAVASGKGIGKSALVSWIILWAMSTFPDTKGVLTAGTEPQLRTKTWPEVHTWYNRLICKHWFHITSTSLYAADLEHEKTWRFDAIPWNASRMEAFAGLHNLGKRIVVVFDESSQIDDVIWDTTDGIFTDANTEVLFAAFGNPTRGQGRFFDCFNKFRHRWFQSQIDSRTVPISDKKLIKEYIEDYGEDSDYVRMNVRGLFPRVSSMQFIGNEDAEAAAKREAYCHLNDALIMGVDVARFGDDESVIAFRKGRDARSIPWKKLRGADTMQFAAAVAECIERYKADAVFIDGGGVGGGVVDRLRQLGHQVRDIQFGAHSDRSDIDKDATRYANKRAEMWGYMRASLPGLAIPDDKNLIADLTGVLYGYRDGVKGAEIILEKKDHMKKRGLPSPDNGDALALTYAYQVMPRNYAGGAHQEGRRDMRHQANIDYDILQG
jgi:hypothetical protein